MDSSKHAGHPGHPRLVNEVVLPLSVLAVPASTSLTSFEHSTAAQGTVVQDLFVQQHLNSQLRAMVLSELKNLAAINMAQAAADFMEPEDAAAGAADAGPAAAGKKTASQ